MRILRWYILKQHLVPLLLGFGVVTFILEMDVLFDYLDLVINRGVAPLAVLQLFLLSLGYIVALSVPCAVLVAVLMTFGRLSQDNEITALRASGVNLASVLVGPLLAADADGGGPHVLQRPRAARDQPRLRQSAHRHRPHAAHGEAPGGGLHHRLPGLQPAGAVRERAHQRDAGRHHLPDERRRPAQPHPGQARLPDLHPRRPHGRARAEGRGDPRDPGRRGRLRASTGAWSSRPTSSTSRARAPSWSAAYAMPAATAR